MKAYMVKRQALVYINFYVEAESEEEVMDKMDQLEAGEDVSRLFEIGTVFEGWAEERGEYEIEYEEGAEEGEY